MLQAIYVWMPCINKIKLHTLHKIQTFSDVTLCQLVNSYQLSKGSKCLWNVRITCPVTKKIWIYRNSTVRTSYLTPHTPVNIPKHETCPLPPIPGPLNPHLAGNMLRATQCYICRRNIDNEKTSRNPFHSKAKTEQWSGSPISRQAVKDNFSTDTVWIDNIKNLTPGVLAVCLCQGYNNLFGDYGRVLLHIYKYIYFFFTLCIELHAAHTRRLNFAEVLCTTQKDERAWPRPYRVKLQP